MILFQAKNIVKGYSLSNQQQQQQQQQQNHWLISAEKIYQNRRFHFTFEIIKNRILKSFEWFINWKMLIFPVERELYQ